MKNTSLILGLLWLSAVGVRAQFAVNWFTIDGGGGTSTGGVFSVSGTVGQPDAGPSLTGGSFAVTGGFWALPAAVQSTNGPTLSIVWAGSGQVRISWTPATPGFVLQEKATLQAAWADAPSGSANPVIIPATLPARFYRVFKP